LKPGSFQDKLHKAQSLRGTNRALLLAPRLTKMPLPMQRYDDPFLPFGKAIIAATQDLVCAYVFDLAAYLAIGAAGAVALERTIASVDDDTITILHGPFIGSAYIAAAEAFKADAVTLANQEDVRSYEMAGMGAWMAGGWHTDEVFSSSALADDGTEWHLLIFGENVLYAGRGDDFAEQVRAKLQ
jgi:hypothetical protein